MAAAMEEEKLEEVAALTILEKEARKARRWRRYRRFKRLFKRSAKTRGATLDALDDLPGPGGDVLASPGGPTRRPSAARAAAATHALSPTVHPLLSAASPFSGSRNAGKVAAARAPLETPPATPWAAASPPSLRSSSSSSTSSTSSKSKISGSNSSSGAASPAASLTASSAAAAEPSPRAEQALLRAAAAARERDVMLVGRYKCCFSFSASLSLSLSTARTLKGASVLTI
jgi:hypothetical protein